MNDDPLAPPPDYQAEPFRMPEPTPAEMLSGGPCKCRGCCIPCHGLAVPDSPLCRDCSQREGRCDGLHVPEEVIGNRGNFIWDRPTVSYEPNFSTEVVSGDDGYLYFKPVPIEPCSINDYVAGLDRPAWQTFREGSYEIPDGLVPKPLWDPTPEQVKEITESLRKSIARSFDIDPDILGLPGDET